VNPTIALDAMGGDHGPEVVIPAALYALDRDPGLRLILVGPRDVLRRDLDRQSVHSHRLVVHHASQWVAMDEAPAVALRSKKDSSMRVAINLVKEGVAEACVSAGNTGALMATARFVLKTLAGIDRPAICSALPTISGHTHVLDLGANVDSTPEQLVQFAVMGSVLVNAVDNIERPSVGLLNIGHEDIKGNERVRQTARLLAAADLNYAGFVEGDDIYKGIVDVVVCDGFVGNVALKSSEGVAHMIRQFLKEEFTRNLFTRFSGLLAMPALKALRRKMDPRRYNGATLLGLRGIVVKSHGGADTLAFGEAIMRTVKEIAYDVPSRISEQMDTRLAGKEAS
jgi:glycerol-3-phosphate acyltransferase PlsX